MLSEKDFNVRHVERKTIKMIRRLRKLLNRKWVRCMDDTDITIEQLKSKQNNGAIIIDVRSPQEYEEGHIPNAILIELDKIEDIVDIISDKNKKIYLYCRSGRRSQIAADIVNKLGYINVINIGGILDYKGKII